MSNTDVQEYAAEAGRLLADETAVPADNPLSALGHNLVNEFEQAELARRETELRWLQDLRQYRGKYDPEVEQRIGKKRSKAFVRKTRVKVKTVDSRVQDLLFPSGSERNWDISETPKPSLSPDQEQEINQLLQQVAQAQQTAITPEMRDQATMLWAKKRAKAMAKTIDDQLTEARYKRACMRAIHSGNLYGTGILKGPLVERKVRTRFIKNGNSWVPQSESFVVPFVDDVPLWRFYPDMASTELDQCRYVYERHLMTKSDMGELSRRKSFRGDLIVNYMAAHPKGEVRLRSIDQQLSLIGDRITMQGDIGGRYEVLERWGWLDGQQLRDAGVTVPDDRLYESFFSNIWLMPDGTIIKAALQPINGVTWPYHIYYFDKDESSIFGEGLASIMRDDQTMLNAATRLMLDNAAITSGPQLEVNTGLLSSIENVDEVTPWRIWLRNNANPGVAAVRAIDLPSRLQELSAMATMFDQNADEVTAIPRYVTGENAQNGAAGTSGGLSMLMGNVNIVLKDLIGAFDEGVTRSFITGMYYWNMQFNPDDTIKGDFDVKARGVASLVAKEIRAEQLNQFAAMTANPMDAPYIKRDVLNRQRAEALDLTDVVLSEDEVAAQQNSQAAQQQAQMQAQVQQLQLQEAQAKVSKLLAEAEVAKNKAQEMLATIELKVAQTIQAKVEAAYAALQAGGVATSSPFVAPAGDEILRSAGWQDATPATPISDLDRRPVQQSDGIERILNNGQTMAVEPRVGPGGTVEVPHGGQAPSAMASAQPSATGMVGREAGIETPATGDR